MTSGRAGRERIGHRNHGFAGALRLPRCRGFGFDLLAS
jgi:hypothetical protein